MSTEPRETPAAPAAIGTVRCPTCRAEQEWSDTCRRCKSDLRLLRAFDAAYRKSRETCLESLRQGLGTAALSAARRCQELKPGTESHRLVAMAALLANDWATASTLARRLAEQE